MPTTKLGFVQCSPPSFELTTRYWSSNCSPGSQSAWFWLFMKAT